MNTQPKTGVINHVAASPWRYLGLFAAVELGVLAAATVLNAFTSIHLGHVAGLIALIAGAKFATLSFVRSRARTFTRGEYAMMLLGSLAIDTVLQLGLQFLDQNSVRREPYWSVAGDFSVAVLVHACLLALQYSDRMVKSDVRKA